MADIISSAKRSHQSTHQLDLPQLPEPVDWKSDLSPRLIAYFANHLIKHVFPKTALGIDAYQIQRYGDSKFSTAYSHFYSSDWKSKFPQLLTIAGCQYNSELETQLAKIVPAIKDFFQPYNETTVFHIYPRVTYRHQVVYPWLVLGNLLMSLNIHSPDISQLALQVALLRANNISISRVIIFNPLIPAGLIWDISEWNHRPLLQKLSLNKVYSLPDLDLNHSLVGRTSSVESVAGIYIALNNWVVNNKNIVPTQIYIDHSVTLYELLGDSTYESCKQLVINYRLPLFIHSSFRANISRTRSGTFIWLIDGVKRVLIYGQNIGASGVVVHTGSHVDMDPSVGLANMRSNIAYLLQFASPTCPLLLETPAGKGTQQLITLKELAEFYLMICKLNPAMVNRFKICVDTCHVHDAGYHPINYLVEWEKLVGAGSIGLIHLNDSETPLGGRRDRHAYPGCGFIGSKMLQQVIAWGNKHLIPMIIEA